VELVSVIGLAGHLPQSRIDAVLPSRAVLLEVLEHILVNAQGDGFLRFAQPGTPTRLADISPASSG
jgi:hypothetical protein